MFHGGATILRTINHRSINLNINKFIYYSKFKDEDRLIQSGWDVGLKNYGA